MTKPPVPRMVDLLAPAVDALIADLEGSDRDARETFANHGRYADILRGWRGQAEVCRARLTREVIAKRRTLAETAPLRDLAKSEYFTELPPNPQIAIGEATLQRTIINASSGTAGNFPQGSIPEGTKLKRTAAKGGAVVATQDAEFVTVESAVCGVDDSSPPFVNADGTWTHTQQVKLAIEATSEGPHANVTEYYAGLSPLTAAVSSPLFAKFTVAALTAAGGSLGVVDDQLRTLALVMAMGSYGPTAGAAVAGVLSNPGARHAVYVNDTVNAVGRVFVADESWASSQHFREMLLDSLRTKPWIGWGCRLSIESLTNYGIVVAPSVLLRSHQYDTAQLEITANIKTAMLAYFDDRPDWYTWTLNAIGGAIAGADARILACTAVAVRFSTGALIASINEAGVITGSEPPPVILPGAAVIHYSLVGEQIDATYSVPS